MHGHVTSSASSLSREQEGKVSDKRLEKQIRRALATCAGCGAFQHQTKGIGALEKHCTDSRRRDQLFDVGAR